MPLLPGDQGWGRVAEPTAPHVAEHHLCDQLCGGCAGRRSGHGRAAALRRVRRDWAGGPGKFLYMMEGAGPGRGEAGPRPEVEPAEGSGDFASSHRPKQSTGRTKG